MQGPYSTRRTNQLRTIVYCGNKLFPGYVGVESTRFTAQTIHGRLEAIIREERFHHLHVIDSEMFFAIVSYFRGLGADWCSLPLTTRMISSPGEVYAGKTLDYTTDTLPIDIHWFDTQKQVFLSESSQFYLEMRLLQKNVEKVFSIYNSFRKEPADYCHLSEFQHVEFEGRVSFEENLTISVNLLAAIVKHLCQFARESLEYFLTEAEIQSLERAFVRDAFKYVTLKEALALLYEDTGDSRYQEFSLKHFGSWEEIRLTEILDAHVIVTEFPTLQIPFYHNILKMDQNGIPLAENADIILKGFRETIGAGIRISDPRALEEKARIFNLPIDAYQPYLAMRDYTHYQKTAGFGLGWQRFTQWILKLPVIWEACHVPRGHLEPIP